MEERNNVRHALERFREPARRLVRAAGVLCIVLAITLGTTETATFLSRLGLALFVASFVL